MQLSKKTAILFFVYLNAAFLSQKKILERRDAYRERFHAQKKMILSIKFSGR
jgi:hypothetical protein